MVILISLGGICLKLYKFYNRRNVNFSCTYKLMKGLTSYFVILFCQIILFTNIWCSFKPMCLIFFNRGPSRVTENRAFFKNTCRDKNQQMHSFSGGIISKMGVNTHAGWDLRCTLTNCSYGFRSKLCICLTLKEGWQNPSVFQGLRLWLDQNRRGCRTLTQPWAPRRWLQQGAAARGVTLQSGLLLFPELLCS